MSMATSSEPFRARLNQKKYLNELGALVGRAVHPEEFGSLEVAASIREAGQKFVGLPSQVIEIPFSDRCSERFKGFVQRLYDANHSSVYLWTPRTITCGTFLVSSILEINFDFEFSLNEEGMLVFLTGDLEDRLLLDFYESSTREKILKIETQGPCWERVIY